MEEGFKKCGRAACSLCPYAGRGLVKSIKISSTGEDLLIQGHITCNTRNILYIGTCSKGDKTCPDRPQYCGETGKTGEERFCGHRNSIVQACYSGTTLPVGEHFQLPGHNVSDFVFTPVEKIYSTNIFVRKVRERHLINRLDLIDNGLNRKL